MATPSRPAAAHPAPSITEIRPGAASSCMRPKTWPNTALTASTSAASASAFRSGFFANALDPSEASVQASSVAGSRAGQSQAMGESLTVKLSARAVAMGLAGSAARYRPVLIRGLSRPGPVPTHRGAVPGHASGETQRFFGATYGFHCKGVTARGVPLPELTQPVAVSLNGLRTHTARHDRR
jgi:hypothetical protein